MLEINPIVKQFENDFGWANRITEDVINIVIQNPKDMPFAWGVIQQIYNILLPVGYMLIVLFFLMEFLKQNTDFHNISMEKTASLVVKLVIAKVIMDSSFELLMAIFAFTNTILSNISKSTSSIPIFDINTLEAMYSQMNPLDQLFFKGRMMMYGIFMGLIKAGIYMQIYGRLIELFVLTAFAPIPLAGIASGELNSTSKRYLQEFFAVALQGVVIVCIVLIYGGVAQEFMFKDLGVWGVISSTLLLLMMLLKSGAIARKLTGA